MARGYVVCHENAVKSKQGKIKTNRWRLNPRVAERCREVPGCPVVS